MVSTEHIIGYGKGAISLRFSREQRTSASKARGEREVGVSCERNGVIFAPILALYDTRACLHLLEKHTHTN